MSELKEATQALFGWLGNFEKDWQEGRRAGLERDDILFMTPDGSYARMRGSEIKQWGRDEHERLLYTQAFNRLRAILTERAVYVTRDARSRESLSRWIDE